MYRTHFPSTLALREIEIPLYLNYFLSEIRTPVASTLNSNIVGDHNKYECFTMNL